MDIGNILAKLGLDTSEFDKKINGVSGKFNSAAKKMAIAGGAMSLAVTTPLMLMANKLTQAWDGAIQAETKINAVIKSTGAAAGKTKDQLVSMSQAMQQKTTFGDDVVQGAQAMLLTFTQVRGAIYDKAIPAIADLATMMGTDLESSAIMIGKALNDPITGMTNLRRVGVSFTKEQIDLTKKLVAEGKLEEAQMMILNELQKEFGGQAEAAAKQGLGPMKQMQNNIGDLMEQMGKIILDGLKPFFEWVSKLALKFQTLSDGTKKFIIVVGGVSAAVGPLLVGLGGVVRILPIIATGANIAASAFKNLTKAIMSNPYLALAAAIIAIGVALYKLNKSMNSVSEAQKRMSVSISEAQLQISKERTNLSYLFTQLKTTNQGSAERKKWVDKINESYGEYLPNMLTEYSSLKDIEAAYASVNKALARKILLQAKEKTLTEELEPLNIKQAESIGQLRELLERMGNSQTTINSIMEVFMESLQKNPRLLRDSANMYQAFASAMNNVLHSFEVNGNRYVNDVFTKGYIMSSNFGGVLDDLRGYMNEAQQIQDKITGMFDPLIGEDPTLTGYTPGGGLGDENDPNDLAKQLGAYEQLNKKISEAQAKLNDLVTLLGQGMATQEQQAQIPILTQELNKLMDLKKQIDETWITGSKKVKDAFDEDLENMSKSRMENTLTEEDALKAQFGERYDMLEKLYSFEVQMYGHLADEKIRLDEEYKVRREKLDSEYMLHMEEFNRKEREERMQTIDELRRVANDMESVTINLRQEYYNTAMFLSQAVVDGLITESEKVQILQQLYKKLKKDIEAANNEADKIGAFPIEGFSKVKGGKGKGLTASLQDRLTENQSMTSDIGGAVAGAINSLPDAIINAISAQQELRQNLRDTIAELESQWKSGALSYADYMKQMTDATKQFEIDSKKISIGKTIIEALSSLMKQIGSAILGIATAKIALSEAWENPYVAAAAGLALIAGGAALQLAVQGLASGGYVTQGGSFLVGENGPELVNLKAGTAVTPNHALGGMPYELVSRISGRDLEVIMRRSQSQSNNRRG